MYPHFIGDDAGQRRLSESGRSVEQDVVQRFSACFRCAYVDRKRLLGFLLPDIIRKELRTQFAFDLDIFFKVFCCNDPFSPN